ncbi:MAG: hypothetical protein LBV00_07470 [Propionibacteriaceae bacterium]|jgi:hypothetical protein|nr:hypothetical protein [Propionibacteriaceae bacterium]
MIRLDRPATTAKDAYDKAVASIRDSSARKPYASASVAVIRLCSDYDETARIGMWAGLTSVLFEVPGVTDTEMVDLYDKRFRRSVRTKEIRNAILNAPSRKRCPYCGEGCVSELDHYLPKTRFSAITVYPANLVPACHECNCAKLDYSPENGKPAVLHPYFDRAFDLHWLVASLNPSDEGPILEFAVSQKVADPALRVRLETHLDVFKLRDRFRVWASRLLDKESQQLINGYSRKRTTLRFTASEAQNHFLDLAHLESDRVANSWEGATYQAMAESDWYIKDYLRLI